MQSRSHDTVLLQGAVFYPKIGCTAEERSLPQKIVLNLNLKIPAQDNWEQVDLSGSVDYAVVHEKITELLESREWVLCEHLASAVCQLLFHKFSLIQEIEIEVLKFVVPHTQYTGVRFHRLRA